MDQFAPRIDTDENALAKRLLRRFRHHRTLQIFNLASNRRPFRDLKFLLAMDLSFPDF